MTPRNILAILLLLTACEAPEPDSFRDAAACDFAPDGDIDVSLDDGEVTATDAETLQEVYGNICMSADSIVHGDRVTIEHGALGVTGPEDSLYCSCTDANGVNWTEDCGEIPCWTCCQNAGGGPTRIKIKIPPPHAG